MKQVFKVLIVFEVLSFFCARLEAANWYVSSTKAGNGTLANPGSLSNAISGSGWASKIAGGDTVWLRGGSGSGYLGGPLIYNSQGDFSTKPWNMKISGSSTNAMITWRSYPNEWAVIGGEWTFGDTKFHRFQDLEFYDPYKGANPTNISSPNGPWTHFANHVAYSGNEFINCVIHDVGNCFKNGGPPVVRGCIFWYVGLNALEHLSYASCSNFVGNVAFWTAQDTINFASQPSVVMKSNIFAGLGQGIAARGSGAEVRMGLSSGAVSNAIFEFNYIYNAPTSLGPACLLLDGNSSSADGSGLSFSVLSNVLVAGVQSVAFMYNPVGSARFMGNTCLANITVDGYPVFTMKTNAAGWTVDYNRYYSRSPNNAYFVKGENPLLDLNQWQSTTGYDMHSTTTNFAYPPDAVYVIPNQDQAKRAHIAIYNWTLKDNVSVDVSSVLASGDRFELYSVQNFNGGPIGVGTNTSGVISIPMTNLTVAPFICAGNWMRRPPPLNPEFGAFVLIGHSGNGPPRPAWDLHVIPKQ
jgi:hypothetical protein